MIGNSVARVSASEAANKRRPLAVNTLGRLGIITVVTIGLHARLATSWASGSSPVWPSSR